MVDEFARSALLDGSASPGRRPDIIRPETVEDRAREVQMYGTVARTRVKPENREKLQAVMERQTKERMIPGMITAYTLYENDSDVAWMFAVFEDRATYDKNADDPAMNDQYVEYRAFMEDDPEWHDGEILGM
jgi:quinol monooxygenase YgiN